MQSDRSLGDVSCLLADEKREPSTKATRRGSISNFVWPPPKASLSSSSSSLNGSVNSSSAFYKKNDVDLFSPTSSHGRNSTMVPTPKSAGPRISFAPLQITTPSTPKSAGRPSAGRPSSYSKPRMSTKLKKLWPPLEAQEAPLSPGVSPGEDSSASLPSPFTSPVIKTVKTLGAGLQFAPPLEANTARRRTLKTKWPPVPKNRRAKPKRKKSLEIVKALPGLTKARRSIFDNGKVPVGPFDTSDSLHRSRSNHDRDLSPKRPELKETLKTMYPESSADEFGFDDGGETTESITSANVGKVGDLDLFQGEGEKKKFNGSEDTYQIHDGKLSAPLHFMPVDARYPDIILPSGQKLPPPSKRQSKRRRTNYRIQYDGPTTLNLDVYGPLVDIPEIDIPESDDRFELSQNEGSMHMPRRRRSSPMGRDSDGLLIMPRRRTSSPMGREGDGADSIPPQPGRSCDEDSFSDDDIFDIDATNRTPEQKRTRPDIWMTPLANEDPGERKWMLKRVWYVEDMDDKEEEYTVNHEQLVPSIQKLCGVPCEGLDKNLDIADDGGLSAPWLIQKIYDIEGEQAHCEEEVVCTADAMEKEMTIISEEADHTHHGPVVQAVDSAYGNMVPPPPNLSDDDAIPGSETHDSVEKSGIKGTSSELAVQSAKTMEAAKRRLPMIVLPRGQKLPPPKGRKKGHRTNYQIHYDGPTLLRVSEVFDIPEEDDRFQADNVKDGGIARPARRTSERTVDKDSMPSRPRRSFDDDDFHSDDETTLADKNDSHDEPSKLEPPESNEKSYRPDVWVTPSKIKKPDDTIIWKVRRVWDVDAFDEKEEEHSVDDEELMLKVQELFGVPPGLGGEGLEEGRNLAPFCIKRIYDMQGEIEEVEEGVELSLADMKIEIAFLAEEAKQMALSWERTVITDTEGKPKDVDATKKSNETSVGESLERGDDAVAGGSKKRLPRILPWHKKAKPSVKEEVQIKLWWEE